jgi:hypothetical protein
MTYEEFEWQILRMVYEQGLERIQPAYVAYAMGIPHETASEYLDRAAQSGVLELDVTDDGSIEYFVPGVDPDQPMPDPLWKKAQQADQESQGQMAEQPAPEAGEPAAAVEQPGDGQSEREVTLKQKKQLAADDGSVDEGRMLESDRHGPPKGKGADGSVNGEGGLPTRARQADNVPAALRDHIQDRDQATDGTLDASRGGRRKVVDRDVTVNSGDKPQVLTALENSDHDLPIHIESTDETFSDPSQTIFMRQLRVEGVESEEALREHVGRLFDSLGYRMVNSEDERVRFERGSVTFILALVPLFVLVLPLFVYLFLYCMGRSTIHQEPLELDVQFRKAPGRDDAYEIDLTFIGLHGVVLGAADQRVLNKEVDTLQDELRWALTTG